MLKGYLKLIILFVSSFGFGQNAIKYDDIDRKMDAIPTDLESSTASIASYIFNNFSGTQDRVRAAFYWTASNIAYDVESLGNLKQVHQTSQEKVTAALKTRKGVCMHYAEVFKDITSKLGIETVLVSGYNKIQGEVADLSHVWCASKINDKWYLFDPTWGSGYVNNNKYIKKLNNKFYQAEPKSLLSTHMPFDYLWQFSEYPITNQEFYENKTESADKRIKFDFMNEIGAFRSMSVSEQAKASAQRIEENGIKNSLIAERLDYEKYKITHEKNKDNYAKIQEIISNFKHAGTLFKEFLNYRNTRFMPLLPDEKIKRKIQAPYDMILKCENDLKQVRGVQKENIENLNSIKESIADAKRSFADHLNFVNEYLAKEKPERERMFYIRVAKRG